MLLTLDMLAAITAGASEPTQRDGDDRTTRIAAWPGGADFGTRGSEETAVSSTVKAGWGRRPSQRGLAWLT